jgi:hypothetical protein
MPKGRDQWQCSKWHRAQRGRNSSRRPAGQWRLVERRHPDPEGGFAMGNPNAKVKLIEFGSLTCSHCAEFEEQGGQALIDNYVKKGLGLVRVPQLRSRSL